MTITIRDIYYRIIGIKDDLILDVENPAKEELDEARQKAALKLEGLAMEVKDLMDNEKS